MTLSSNESPEKGQLSTEVSVCNMYVLCESTRLVQRLCAAEAVSSDCVPRCRRRCLSSQLPEAVRPLHLSQMWAQVLQSLLLPIRGERCSVYIRSYLHHTYMVIMNVVVRSYVHVLKLTLNYPHSSCILIYGL